MAKYFLRVTHISRGKGARATRAAAYRSGERIRDERTGEVYDHSDRRDVVHKEVVLPSDLEGRSDMAWTQDRATLWNAMEYAGTRRNSRMAREWLVFLPPELTPAARNRLIRTFAQEIANKYRCAADLAVHLPRPGADPRNHHAHLLTTTREVTPDGVGARTTLELGGRERHERGLAPQKNEYFALRERWAQLTNEALKEAGLTERVDHRSLKSQGINREPVPSIPEKVFYAERRTGPSEAGDAIRARHRERVEARLKGGDELERVIERQNRTLKELARERFRQRDAQPKQIRWSALTREERNGIRRQQHQARRAAQRLESDPAAAVADQAARRWAEYRQTHGPGPTAEDSAQKWKAFRESGTQPDSQKSPPAASRDPQSTDNSSTDDDTPKKRQHDHDLEM